ncbi:hypothetical protein AVEN_205704-1, partial [Araneus ventricosus]
MTEANEGYGYAFGRIDVQLTAQMNQGATKSVSPTTVQRTLLRMGLRPYILIIFPQNDDIYHQDNA